MQILDIRQIPPEHKKRDWVSIKSDDRRYTIRYAEQRTGFGVRKFFVCPVCERRTMRLYKRTTQFACDKCAGINLYKPIQNGTKGGYLEISYRMERYAAKKNIRFEYPFDYIQFTSDPRINSVAFQQSLLVLQALENMRSQNIFFNTVYNPKTIKAVLTGNHPLLSEKSLFEMKQWLWNF